MVVVPTHVEGPQVGFSFESPELAFTTPEGSGLGATAVFAGGALTVTTSGAAMAQGTAHAFEITITRKFIARIPLTGPTGCPFVEAPRDSGRRRMRFDSASDFSDRLVPVTAAAAAAASSSGALQTPRGDTSGEKAASVASVASAGGLPTNATAPASLLPERERNREFSGPEMFAMADDGEGEVGLMKDLQRDPWAVLHEFLCPRTRANMPVCL